MTTDHDPLAEKMPAGLDGLGHRYQVDMAPTHHLYQDASATRYLLADQSAVDALTERVALLEATVARLDRAAEVARGVYEAATGAMAPLEARLAVVEQRADVGARTVEQTMAAGTVAPLGDGSDLMADPERDECWPLPAPWAWSTDAWPDGKRWDVWDGDREEFVMESSEVDAPPVDFGDVIIREPKSAPVIILFLCRNGYLPRPAALAAWRALGGDR